MNTKIIKKFAMLMTILLMTISPCLSDWAYCQEEIKLAPAETRKVIKILKECHNTRETCFEVVEKQKEIIKKQSKIVDLQEKEIKDLNEDKNSIWRNPVFLLSIGALTMGAACVIMK